MNSPPGQSATTGWSSTSSSLLRLAQASDPTAWQRLTDLYLPLVYHWCRNSNLQDHDASDVSQEVFRAVARRIGTFQRDQPGQSFRAWLATITRNKVRDHFRAAIKRPQATGGTDALKNLEQESDAVTESLSQAGFDEIQNDQLYHALEEVRAHCSDHTWQAFWRTTVLDEDPSIVAEELSMTLGSVYQARSRILARLRKEMERLSN